MKRKPAFKGTLHGTKEKPRTPFNYHCQHKENGDLSSHRVKKSQYKYYRYPSSLFFCIFAWKTQTPVAACGEKSRSFVLPQFILRVRRRRCVHDLRAEPTCPDSRVLPDTLSESRGFPARHATTPRMRTSDQSAQEVSAI